MNKQPEPTAADMFNAVGRALYGNDWTAGLAAGLGVERETVRSWRRGHDARFGPGHGAMDDLLALAERRSEETARARDELRDWLRRNRAGNG